MGNCWYFGGGHGHLNVAPKMGGVEKALEGLREEKRGESYAIKAILMQAKGFD